MSVTEIGKRAAALALAILLFLSGCGRAAPEEKGESAVRSPLLAQNSAVLSGSTPTPTPTPEPEAGLTELVLSGERTVYDGSYLYCWDPPFAPDALCRVDPDSREVLILDEMHRMTDKQCLCLYDGYLYYYESRNRMLRRVKTDGTERDENYYDPDLPVYSMQLVGDTLYLNIDRDICRMCLSDGKKELEEFDVGDVVGTFAVVGDTLFYTMDDDDGSRFLYRKSLLDDDALTAPGQRIDGGLWEAVYCLGSSVYYPVYSMEDDGEVFGLKRCRETGRPEEILAGERYLDQYSSDGRYFYYTKDVENDMLPFRYDPVTGTETELFAGTEKLSVYEINGACGGMLWMTCSTRGYGDVFAKTSESADDWLELDEGNFRVTRSELAPTPTPVPTATPIPTATPEPTPEPEEPYGPGTSWLDLKADDDRAACFRLVRMNGSTAFMEFLEAGESKTMGFPCGRYTLKIAEGTEWISDEEAFGPSGHYSTTEVFTFEAGYSYYISAGTKGDFYGDSAGGFLN